MFSLYRSIESFSFILKSIFTKVWPTVLSHYHLTLPTLLSSKCFTLHFSHRCASLFRVFTASLRSLLSIHSTLFTSISSGLNLETSSRIRNFFSPPSSTTWLGCSSDTRSCDRLELPGIKLWVKRENKRDTDVWQKILQDREFGMLLRPQVVRPTRHQKGM